MRQLRFALGFARRRAAGFWIPAFAGMMGETGRRDLPVAIRARFRLPQGGGVLDSRFRGNDGGNAALAHEFRCRAADGELHIFRSQKTLRTVNHEIDSIPTKAGDAPNRP